jgi:uncharacterized membrane protein
MKRTPYARLLDVGTVMFFIVVVLLGVGFLVNVPFAPSGEDSMFVAFDVASIVVLYVMGGVLGILSPNGILAITAWAAFKQHSTNDEIIKHRYLKATATTVAGTVTYIPLFYVTEQLLAYAAW